jgi:hypothetical protein
MRKSLLRLVLLVVVMSAGTAAVWLLEFYLRHSIRRVDLAEMTLDHRRE